MDVSFTTYSICMQFIVFSSFKKFLVTSSIHNYRILFLIIMKDEGPNFFSDSKASCFNYYK